MLALENPRSIDADLTISVGKACSITHETAGRDVLAQFIDRWNGVVVCKGDELLAPAVEKGVTPNQQPLHSHLDKSFEGDVIYLNLYVIRGSNPLRWRSDGLQSIIHTRLVEHASPLVAEGVLILDALGAIGRKPDFLVYVDGKGGHGLSSRIAEYRMRHKPEQQAQFRLNGFAE